MRPYASLRILLLAGAAVVALSCSDSEPVGVSREELEPNAWLLNPGPLLDGLLSCSPLAYDSVTQIIGVEGGTLRVGPHSLTVPPGALSETVAITAVVPTGEVNSVRFQPQGLTFHDGAWLTMSYANCRSLGPLMPKRIAQTTYDLETILGYLFSFDNFWAQRVTAQLNHFSTYAVAW